MKRIFLTFVLLFSLFATAQKEFVIGCSKKFGTSDKVIRDSYVTFIINANETNVIKMYENGKYTSYYPVGAKRKGKTKSGTPYQIIEVITDEGIELEFQLFADTVRIHYPNINEYIEYF
jgi:hypothetical protein